MDGNEIEPEEEELVTESETTLTEVDYGLLMLFIGQFLLIGSFDDTGIPQAFFSVTMGGCADQMTSVPCVYWFVMIVTILSNIASNVPVVQMLAATFPMPLLTIGCRFRSRPPLPVTLPCWVRLPT